MNAETHTHESLLGELLEPPSSTFANTARRIQQIVEAGKITQGDYLPVTFEKLLEMGLKRLERESSVEFWTRDFADRARRIFDYLLEMRDEVEWGDFNAIDQFLVAFNRRFQTSLPRLRPAGQDSFPPDRIGPMFHDDYSEVFGALFRECMQEVRRQAESTG